MPSLVELIGDTLLDNAGKRLATSDLLSDGKVIGLYFRQVGVHLALDSVQNLWIFTTNLGIN